MLNTAFTSVQTIALHSGATLLFNHVPGAPRLALNVYAPGGNTAEAVPGQMDMIDRLLLKGTPTRSAEDIAVYLDSTSLSLGVETKRDYSVMSACLLEEDLEDSLAFMSELLFYSNLEALPVELEKVAAELKSVLDAPKAKAADVLSRNLFAGLPYGVSASVMEEHLAKVGRVDALYMLYQKIYTPKRLVISVAGDVNVDKLVKALNDTFDVPRTKGAVVSTSVGSLLSHHKLPKSQLLTHPWKDAQQAQIYQAWLLPPASHADATALTLLDTLLGSAGLSSRLFLELRDKQGLAYHVRSTLSLAKHRGEFTLYIGTEPSNVQRCLDGFATEIEKLLTIAVSDEELAATKRNVLGRRAVGLETARQQAHTLGHAYMMGLNATHLSEFAKRVEAITAADLMKVAKRYLSQPSLSVVVGPQASLPPAVR
jgi:predicted Zn-dependent peptidase